MAEQFIGKASEFKDGDRQIVRIGEDEIGVFKHEGEYYAYSKSACAPTRPRWACTSPMI